jgi:L-rhamnose isomerase
MHERVKYLPFVDIWNEYLSRQGLSEDWWNEVEKFESEVIAKRI